MWKQARFLEHISQWTAVRWDKPFFILPKLIEKLPFLKGSRLRLSFDNLFDAQRRITDANGVVPLNYQPGYIDPLGRYIELEWRKTF